MLSRSDWLSLEEHLKSDICAACIERRFDGTCALTAVEPCPIQAHLVSLVHVVQSVDSHLIQDYLVRVREEICSICDNSHSAQDCPPRDEGHCALDAYLIPIVESIETFLRKKGLRDHSAAD